VCRVQQRKPRTRDVFPRTRLTGSFGSGQDDGVVFG
jgi:hypothetical protein